MIFFAMFFLNHFPADSLLLKPSTNFGLILSFTTLAAPFSFKTSFSHTYTKFEFIKPLFSLHFITVEKSGNSIMKSRLKF